MSRSRATSRLQEARRIAICPASSTGFCERERRWSVPNPTTSTPPLGSVPRSPPVRSVDVKTTVKPGRTMVFVGGGLSQKESGNKTLLVFVTVNGVSADIQ